VDFEKFHLGDLMKQTLKYIAVSSALLGLLLSVPLAGAQIRGVKGLPGKRAGSSASQAPAQPSITTSSPSYTYTLLSYPGQLYTFALCINKGATTSKTEIVGGYGAVEGLGQAGFLARVSGTKTVTETYQSVSYPHEPAQQDAECINDAGQIVGTYVDSSGVYHGYERSGGKFTTLDVPFTGATATFPVSINNSGEVVGVWTDSDSNDHAFTLIGSTYSSFDYPGGTQTSANDVNSAGDIVGSYLDASGVFEGFLLCGGTYTSIQYSGAVETYVNGINDSGVLVGGYCTTSECETNLNGVQNFLWSGGVFTPVAILPGEVYADVTDINNNGVLVGYYQDAAGLQVSFMATP
jgi:hypothetical protein